MDFRSFAEAHGVQIKRLEQGDRIHRCPTTDHPKSDNGAYWFDGARGWVQDWASGEPVQWWNDGKTAPWSEKEKREWAARRREAEASKEKAQAEAAKRAAVMISLATLDTHPYLKEKGFPEAKCLVTEGGAMLVPMRDIQDDRLLGVQTIRLVDNEWQKKMIFGMRAKGAVLRVGPSKAPESILVEGYATALSVDEAIRLLRLKMVVVVCFSAGNMVYVAPKIKGRVFIYADNDLSQTGETSARATGFPFCMSDVAGHDANDDHVKFGVMAVAKKIMEVRRRD